MENERNVTDLLDKILWVVRIVFEQLDKWVLL